ncbi:MAG: acyl-CoA thioesterase [Pseudomonadota bacterium]
MYPVIRLGIEMGVAALSAPIAIEATHVSRHTCFPWDVDPWGEMNNGRILTLYDLGRVPLLARTGVTAALKRRGWKMTMAGANVRYRRRITMFERVELRSRIVGRDARFLYIAQSMWRSETEAASSIVYRAATYAGKGIVPTDDVVAELGHPDWNPPMRDWVAAWSAAEDQRPWPPPRA